MDEETLCSKSVCLSSFDGLAKLFQKWWLQFMVYASVYGFIQSIQKRIDLNLPATEDTAIDEIDATAAAAAKKAKKLNTIAMASFTMAFTSKLLIDI
eukprot:1928556-Ditylum_brightwellii.AAC.1